MAEVVRVEQVTKRFGGRVAVDDVSFTVAEGETYGLLGPNGAGKTTTISMLCGLLAPDGGVVTIAGHRVVGDAVEAKRRLGYVPQDLALYPDLSGVENLRFFGRLQGLRGPALTRRVEAVLEVVGLSERGTDRVDTYSGGMKRRANIAAGLLHDPQVLVLDEPTVGVDPQSRHAILDSVAELGRAGLSILYTTHYMEEAERLCDRVGIMDRGHLIAEGTRVELLRLVGEHTRIRIDGPALAGDGGLALPGVLEVTRRPGGFDVLVDDVERTLAAVVSAAGGGVSRVEIDQPDLEAVFLHLTGRALRD